MSTLSLVLLLFGWWQAKPPAAGASLDEVCRIARCREARVAQVESPDGQMSPLNVPRSLIVDGDTVSVFVGERLVLALEPGAGGKFRVSAPSGEPPKGQRLELEFKQERLKPGEPKATLLVVTSSVPQRIHFRAEIVLGLNRGGRPTSTCPVAPSVPTVQTWLYPVPLLLLRDFVVAGEGMPCK